MVEPLRGEAKAKAFFRDDMLLLDLDLDLVDAKKRRAPRGGCGGGGGGCGALFLDIFDHADEGLVDEEGGEEEELEWLANKDAFPGLETSFDGAAEAEVKAPVLGASAAAAAGARIPVKPRSKGRRRRRSAAVTVVAGLRLRRRCRHCASEDTPQWRAGPDGPKTLCNACGVRFKSGRLVPEYRPARSPTFVSALHSNSHRRILEMRRLRSTSAVAAAHGGRRGRRRRRADSVVLESPLPTPIC